MSESWRIGTFWGLLFGMVLGIEFGALGGLLPYSKDSFLFVFYFSLIFWAIGASGSLFVCLLYQSWVKLAGLKSSRLHIRRLLISLLILSLLCIQGLLFWIMINRPVYLKSTRVIAGAISIFLLSCCVAFFLGRILVRISPGKEFGRNRRLWQKMWVSIPAYFVFLAFGLFLTSVFVGNIPINKNEIPTPQKGSKILFIGVDALNKDLLDPLLSKGKLPHLSSLVQNGVYGELPSLASIQNPFADTVSGSYKSAAVWTSIMTGKSPSKHGVLDFTYTEIPGIRNPFRYPLLPVVMPARKRIARLIGLETRPFSRGLVKTKAVWHIFNEASLPWAALGWWETWPAENLIGEILSDRFEDVDLPRRWSPPSLVSNEEVNSLTSLMENPDKQDLDHFISFSYQPSYKQIFAEQSREYMLNSLVKNLVKSYYLDKFRSELGLKLMTERDYAFMSVYFYGSDTVGHAFWRFMQPELFTDVNAAEIAYFGKTIEKYLQFIDGEIGKYLELIDDNTVVIIVSDHGMGPWPGSQLAEGRFQVLSGNHRKNGVVILSGQNIKKGIDIRPKSLLDVLPTVLYLSGFAVAQDMDGGVMQTAIESELLRRRPIEFISTYETKKYHFQHLEGITSDRSLDKKQIDRLKALGYIR